MGWRGGIIGVKCGGGRELLKIGWFEEKKGGEYVKGVKEYEENGRGILSVYFGEVEGFDWESGG